MKIGGGSPFRSVSQTSDTSKAKKTKKSGSANKAERAAELATPEAVAPVEEQNSPYYDVMESASRQFEQGESLEEAAESVVSAVLNDRFGPKGLAAKEVEHITKVVTESLTNNQDMRNRLESALRRITARKTATQPK